MSGRKNTESVFKRCAGTIKRQYGTDDFNPFSLFQHLYQKHLNLGEGRVCLIVGYSERYQKEIIKAWHHCLRSKNLVKPNQRPPVPLNGYAPSLQGMTLKFRAFNDDNSNVEEFEQLFKEADVVAMCNKYTHANRINVIRFNEGSTRIIDYSNNNPIQKEEDAV
ncbi:MAG: hypothetical protein HRT61_09910 [Ekhidna sp.]|nr:hypothetical protein [Ekhidna sp.]